MQCKAILAWCDSRGLENADMGCSIEVYVWRDMREGTGNSRTEDPRAINN